MPYKMFFPADDLDPRHAYVRKILDGMARGILPSEPDQYRLIDVKHDWACAMMTRRGVWCDCDPTVALPPSGF